MTRPRNGQQRKVVRKPAEAPATDATSRQHISPMALAATSVDPRKAKQRAPFVLPRPMPGVVPNGTAMAMDEYAAGVLDYANSGGLYSQGMVWPGYAALAELSQLPEYRRISEVIAREMTRKWITFTATGDSDKSDKIKKIEAAFDKFHVRDLFRKIAETDGLFGRAQLFVDLGNLDSDELSTPLIISPKKIAKGGLKRFALIEPMWSSPSQYNSSQPLAPHFYDPQEWFVFGQKVHKSRLLTFVGRELPTFLRASYSFGGLSLSQMARAYIDNFIRTRDSVSDLIHSFSTSGLKTNMAAILMGQGAGGDDLISRMQLFNQTRDNRGIMMLDKETEDFFNISTPLGTLDHLLAQSQEQIASIVGIPLVVLLGVSPAGLNTSSDGEIRVFYDSIHAQQEKLFGRHLETVLKLIQLNEFGEIDDEISYRFEQLWQANEAEQASIRKTDIDSAIQLIAAGVLAPEEERQRLATDDNSLYHGLDVSDLPELPENEEDPAMLPDPAKSI